jgi:hypothetical protein
MILRAECYKGDFAFNKKHAGQFFGINKDGEVVESAELDGPGKVFVKEGAYLRGGKPMVDPALWDKVQRRLDEKEGDHSLVKRSGKYPLVGILYCDHCKKKMHGVPTPYKKEYRCSGQHDHGCGTCKNYKVDEEPLLQFILNLLREEMADLKTLNTRPPEHLIDGTEERARRRGELRDRRERLLTDIDTAESNLMFVKDGRTRQSLDKKVSEMRDRLDAIEAELSVKEEARPGAFTDEELDALMEFWEEFWSRAVSMPVTGDQNMNDFSMGLMQDHDVPYSAVLVDPRKVNDALKQLGARVDLRWETREYPGKKGGNGKPMRRHVLVGGRFRLGQREGKLPQYVLDTSAARVIRLLARLRCCAPPWFIVCRRSAWPVWSSLLRKRRRAATWRP